MTAFFAVIGNVTLYFVEQKFLISASVPGSWPPKSFDGTPNTTRPRARYFSHNASSPRYCGVSPHCEAVVTTSTGVPANCDSFSGLPSMEVNSKSCADMGGPSHVQIDDVERIVLDEFAPRLHQLAHQLGEEIVRLVRMLDFHLQQRAGILIQRGLPQLVGVHLAQAFIALQRKS